MDMQGKEGDSSKKSVQIEKRMNKFRKRRMKEKK
jgi:hypothetical protein